MNNKEYLQTFVLKHGFSSNIHVQMQFGETWDDVISVVFNEKDIPSKNRVPMSDIQFDIQSDLPKDAFMQWFNYCKEKGYIEYKDWMLYPDNYKQHFEVNTEFDLYKKEIEQTIDNVFAEFGERYSAEEYDSDEDIE